VQKKPISAKAPPRPLAEGRIKATVDINGDTKAALEIFCARKSLRSMGRGIDFLVEQVLADDLAYVRSMKGRD
jgi:hypothetical protein